MVCRRNSMLGKLGIQLKNGILCRRGPRGPLPGFYWMTAPAGCFRHRVGDPSATKLDLYEIMAPDGECSWSIDDYGILAGQRPRMWTLSSATR